MNLPQVIKLSEIILLIHYIVGEYIETKVNSPIFFQLCFLTCITFILSHALFCFWVSIALYAMFRLLYIYRIISNTIM